MKKSTHIYKSAVAMLFVLGAGFTAYGAPIQINVLTDDAQVTSTVSASGTPARVGNSSGNPGYVAVIALPELDVGSEFSFADFRVRATQYNSPLFNGDLYGLGYRTSPTVLTTDHYFGTGDATATLIQDDFLNPGVTGPTTTNAAGESALADYLNTQYQASAADRILGEDIYVFLRISPDFPTGGGSYKYYNVDTADHGTAYNRPYMTYDTAVIPEAGTLSLLVLAGFALLAFGRNRK